MAAALGRALQDLSEEATCSICLDYFKDPVITECGHNFCRACLTHCWEGSEGEKVSCPQCRVKVRRNLIPNRQLANFVEIAKGLRFQGETITEGKGAACGKHQEPLKLFCKDDEALICVVCDKSKEHREHQVVPLEEAAQNYKDQTCTVIELLKFSREKIASKKEENEKDSQDLLKCIEAEEEATTGVFRQLHQFLEEQEKLLLAQMKELKEEIARERDELQVEFSTGLATLDGLIQETEESYQKPPYEYLKDLRKSLMRHVEPMESVVPEERQFSPSLKWKTWEFSDINPFLQGIMKQFKDMFVSGLQPQKANVTLDPDTAHPRIKLTNSHKTMRIGFEGKDLPPNPKRFDHYLFALGREEFKEGRHFWEVTVSRSEDWAVGVARSSVRRKGRFACGPEEGFWVVGHCEGEHTIPGFIYVSEVKTIRVSLNHPGKRLAFYNGKTGDLLCVFSAPLFSGEPVRPFFYLGEKGGCFSSFKTELTLAP
uniref:RING-type E3 ubiquitin transferase n=1 Tax=Pogona vitticeps TaxID=103695 RepID=A0ABM5FHE5_9SAUR